MPTRNSGSSVKRTLGDQKMVRLAGLEPATGKTPADFKPAAYANFATAAPNGHAAQKAYHAE
jgi:hypothetical protein